MSEDIKNTYKEDIKNGRGEGGKFVKGNVCGKYSHRKDGVRAAVAKAMTDDEAALIFQRLIKSTNDSISMKALELWLAYRHGRPTKIVESETTLKVDNEINDEVNDLIKGLQDDK